MSRHGFGVYPDLVKGAKIMRPGQVWGSDITYWRVAQCFYFVFLVTDSCSSKIIVCHVALGMDGAHVRAALHMAMRKSDHALHGIIHHSDRGSQYCCTRYVNTLKEYGTMVSMTEDSDPRDNAIAYRVNGIL
jgi:transposase InsO family protein